MEPAPVYHTMEHILHTCSETPVDMTYLGIGSSPHIVHEQLEAKNDQLIPQCFHPIIFQDKRRMRILHFDPGFSRVKDFLEKYFRNLDLHPVEFEGGLCWKNKVLEVYCIPMTVSYLEHFWFFEHLCETILRTNGKLLVQDYTGYGVDDLNRKLYETTEEKDKYKRRILFDMTFGTDSGCSTDMTKAQPFYDYSGDFLNLHFLKPHEVNRWISVSDKLDILLKLFYKRVFLQRLNDLHVDYRRVLVGDPPRLCDSNLTSDQIMSMLQTQLRELFEMLLSLRVVQQKDKDELTRLFQDYKTHDPYKWYSSVTKIFST